MADDLAGAGPNGRGAVATEAALGRLRASGGPG